MINKSMEEAINKQIQAEFYSAYLYLSMAAYCQRNNWKGFAHWMNLQFKEEQSHAMKMMEHVIDRGGKVKLMAIDKPPVDFKSPLDIFEQTLEHEQRVTGLIDKLYRLAKEEKDSAAEIMLQWFVSEQVEEEAHATEIMEKLRMIGDHSGGLFYIDKELGKRA